MKETNKLGIGLAMMLCILTALVWSSCTDEPVDLTASRSAFVLDSMRLADSLAQVEDAETRAEYEADRAYQRTIDSLDAINQGGGISYAVNVVDGATSSFSGRTNGTKTLLTGAIVTVSQFGKSVSQTTTATGMAVFSGFFRNSLNVTITKAGYASVNYIVAVQEDNNTPNGTQHTVGNIIPLYPTTGPFTATISGRLTIQTDLTNKTREMVPDGTTLSIGIDASNLDFIDQGGSSASNDEIVKEFSNYNPSYFNYNANTFYVGEIELANIETGVVGSTTAGLYTVTVPAAFDGLPIVLNYSQIAANQTLYENSGVIPGDRTATYRNIFGGSPILYSAIPAGSAVSVGFEAFTTAATATAGVSSSNGAIDKINVTNGGAGYSGTPIIRINGGGTGAAATATVVNGVVTGITVTSPGSGYVSPTITFLQGTAATATVTGLDGTQTVLAVSVANSGTGYTSAPTVTFSGGGGTTQATGTAVITNGKVTSVTVNTPGVGYTSAPTIAFTGGGTPTVNAVATAIMSGLAIGDVSVTGGSGYTYPPAVTFGLPNLSTGTRATGVAIIDANTQTVVGIQVINAGSGYTASPSVTLAAFTTSGVAEVFTTGGSVISVDMATNGEGYVGTPGVKFTGGSGTGATGTAVMANGKVIGVTITSAGAGYTSAPTVTFVSGSGAVGYATVVNGVITAVTVSDGGFGWTEAPRVTLTGSTGGGATATTTVAGGAITGVTVTAGGTGYLEGNVPSSTENFQGPTGPVPTHPGLKYVVDGHYGTGKRQPN